MGLISRGWAAAHERVRAALQMMARLAADELLEQWSGLAAGEHDVHPSVEFRTRNQISLSPGFIAKAGVILNGRSQLNPHGVALGSDVYLKERCVIDAYGGFVNLHGPAGIGQGTFMHGGGGLSIGSYVIMGPNCQVVASNHAFVSPDYPIMLQGDRRKGIVIGNNVWLGAGVTVLDGVTIGDNVVVGAGVVLQKSVQPNTLVRSGSRLHTEAIRFTN